MSQEQATGFQVGANINPFEVAMRRMVESASSAQSQLSGIFGKMNGALAAASAALAGGAMLKASVDATQQFTEESNKLARVLGTTATEASALNVALGDIYTDADTFTAAAGKLAKELRTNEAALQGMGLQTRDNAGNLRPLNDLMMDSIQVVNSYKQGIDRNIAAQQLWGKSAEESSKLLKLNTEVVEAARKKQEELGLMVGQENVEASKAYKAAMNDVGDVMLALQKAIGDAVIPVLTRLGEWFSEIGPAAVVVIKGAIGGLVAVFWGLKNAVTIVWEVIAGVIETLTVSLAGVGEGFYKILTGDLQGGVAAFRGATEAIGATWEKRMGNMVESSRDAQEKIWNLFAAPTPAAAPKNAGGKSANGLMQSDSQLAKWDAELNAMKQAHADKNAAEGTFYEFSKERELAFWAAKKAIVTAGSKDAFGVQAKITAATLDIQKGAFETRLAELQREQAESEQNFARKAELAQRELALIIQRYGAESKQAEDAKRKIEDIERAARDQRKQLREIEIAETAAAGNQRVEMERQRLQFEFDAGLITRAQQIAAEQEFEQQKFAIQSAALAQRQTMVDPDLNPVEYARIKNEMLQLEQQYQLKLGQLRSQAALENTALQRDMFSSIRSGFENSLAGLIQGTMTLQGALKAVWNSILQGFSQLIAKKVTAWALGETAKTGATVAGNTARATSDWWAAARSVAANAWAAVKNIAIKAWEVAASVYAAIAAIPVIGPFLAPVMAVAATGVVLGYASKVASAEGGYDIPAGLNPLTQLHEQEMVLPAKHADVIRGLADGGEGAGMGGGITVNVHATDAQSVARLFRDNGDALVKALASRKRDFAF